MQYSQTDYILIWGHGLKHKNEIIDIIENNENFDILKIIYYHPKKIQDLVKAIYSYDYAPFHHLKAKTEYLKQTPGKVLFLFVKNNKPEIDYRGEGDFRHQESLSLKALKEQIRNKYNPRINGQRTEDHVIHASDNEAQTDYILEYIGYKNGINDIISKSKILDAPHHLGNLNNFKLKKIKIPDLYCTVLQGTPDKISKKIVHITESPHYKTLENKPDDYQKYLDKFQGYYLTDYYSVKKFLNLKEKLHYLDEPYSTNYIIVKKNNSRYIVQDGVHRACILKKEILKI